jgi:non-specific serine/threonine protein kinase
MPASDTYTLGERIGSGAMGDVYQGIDTRSGAAVAIKALKPDLMQRNPALLTRFLREGEALRQLNHPNIVALLDTFEREGMHYLVMEHIAGGDLATRLSHAPEGLPLGEALSISLDLADALTRAHRLGIIHRDFKPANILLAEDGSPRLSDFGIAHVGGEGVITETGSTLGTLSYLAPEGCMGEALDERADIWAFGISLYEMLTGQRPFKADNPAALIRSILNTPLPDPTVIRGEIPPALADLLYRMLDKNRDSRIPSVRLVGAELESLLKRGEIAAGQVAPRHAAIATTVEREASLFETPASDTGQGKQNLPRQATPFVGREAELDELARLLADPAVSLITILGPGGMGKSRLSIESAGRHLPKFEHGATFVELAPLSDVSAIPAAIAVAVGYQFTGTDDQATQIVSYLGNKNLLLILDNFEHLIAGATLARRINEAAPGVKLIATSRQKLNLSGEHILTIGGMEFPEWETPEDAMRYSAVKLFMQSAKRARVDFELQPEDLQYVARICRLTQGMPLGILLAAAWVDMMSIAEISEEIAQGVDILATQQSDVPERHRSMRAAFDYSWKLLSEDERAAYARMSVFHGGCSRRAAQSVTGASLPVLTAMVNKSLLHRDAESGTFNIHELLRQIAEEHLDTSGVADTIRAAHSEYYLAALVAKEADLKGHDQLAALEDIESDFENVRAAWLWAVDHKDHEALLAACESLVLFCDSRSRAEEGKALLAAALDIAPPQAISARIRLACLPYTFFDAFGPSKDPAALQPLVDLAHKSGTPADVGLALFALGKLVVNLPDLEKALPLFEESLTLFEQAADLHYQCLALGRIGFCHSYLGIDPETAIQTTQRAYDIAVQTGNLFEQGRMLNNLSAGADAYGNIEEGIEYGRKAVEIRRRLNDKAGLSWSLSSLANTSAYQDGDLVSARVNVNESLALAREINNPISIAYASLHMATVLYLEADYSECLRLIQAYRPIMQYNRGVYEVAGFYAALALGGLGQWGGAARGLREAISEALELQYASVMPGVCTLAALILAQRGNLVRCAELLSLAQTSSIIPGWLKLDPLLPPLRARFESELSAEELAAASERGKGLDVMETGRALLEELAE